MNKADNFQPWELNWEEKHVKRFWDWEGQHPEKLKLYFSSLLGDSILSEVNHYINLTGIIVDWGSGPGFMVEKLLERGYDTFAVDSSIDSINVLDRKFAGTPHFLGAEVSVGGNLSLRGEFADVVLLIETIEHLDDGFLENVLSNVHGVLKPGGVLIVTTPNQENLKASHVMCPNCGCVFHNVQHLRSFSQHSLHETMKNAGFQELMCKPTLFSQHSFILRQLQIYKLKFKRRSLPHLLYIGKKV